MEINLLWCLCLQDPDHKYEILGVLLLSSWAGCFHLFYFSSIKNWLKLSSSSFWLKSTSSAWVGIGNTYSCKQCKVYFKTIFDFKGSLPRWLAWNLNALSTSLLHSDTDLTSKIWPATPVLKPSLRSHDTAKGFLKSKEIMSAVALLSAVIVPS